MNKNPRAYQKRNFICKNCGAVNPAIKYTGRGKTPSGHRKDFYCFACKDITSQIQFDRLENVVFEEKGAGDL